MSNEKALTYTNHLGHELDLVSPTITVQTAAALRGHAWSYTTNNRAIDGTRLNSQNIKVDFSADKAAMRELQEVANQDVAAQVPGVFESYGWRQSGYITACDIKGIYPAYVDGTLTIELLDGIWRKSQVLEFYPQTASTQGSGLDFAYDFAYDFAQTIPTIKRVFKNWQPSDFKLTIYGAVTNPRIMIGQNLYKVDAAVSTGGILEIDSLGLTATLKDEHGYTENVFSKATRSTGLNSGEYIFQPITPGEQVVAWENTYGFTLEYYQTQTQPPWETPERSEDADDTTVHSGH